MLYLAILGFVCFAGFKLIAELRIGKSKDIATELCAIIKPHTKFRDFYLSQFEGCRNQTEKKILLEIAEAKEQKFDLHVIDVLATNASRSELKKWLKFYKDNPSQPFKHASERFNQKTTDIAGNMLEDIFEDARHKMDQKEA